MTVLITSFIFSQFFFSLRPYSSIFIFDIVLPSIVILDKEGVVSYSHAGVQNFETLEADIERQYQKAKMGVNKQPVTKKKDPYGKDVKLLATSSIIAGFDEEVQFCDILATAAHFIQLV